MKVLVTGHRGFLGTGFLRAQGRRYELTGFDHKDGKDILDFDQLAHACRGCDQVVHLAGIGRPDETRTFDDYLEQNVIGTANVARACETRRVRRLVFASSMAVYGLEEGVPFATPLTESHPSISQFAGAASFGCPPGKLAYHVSKVMAEQVVAWYGLTRRLQTVALRFGPIDRVFLATSLSMENAALAIRSVLDSDRTFWYEAFTISDDLPHVDLSKAKDMLRYKPSAATHLEP